MAAMAVQARRTTVADVMTSPVVTVTPSTPFKEVARLLTSHHIGALPVVGVDGRPVGVVSESDLILKEEGLALTPGPRLESHRRRHDRAKAAARIAGEMMSSPPVTIGAGAPLAAAARLMHEQSVRRLLVVDEDGGLRGIVSRGDLVRAFLRTDSDIRETVVEDIVRHTMWLDPATLDVVVIDGVVHLGGRLERATDVDILAQLVRGTDGVVDVTTDIAYDLDDRALRYRPSEARV